MDRHRDAADRGMAGKSLDGTVDDGSAADPAVLLRTFSGLASPLATARRDNDDRDLAIAKPGFCCLFTHVETHSGGLPQRPAQSSLTKV